MRRAGTRIGGLAGSAGAIMIAVGLALMPAVPGPDTSAPDVYSYFLDASGEVQVPSALIGVGLILAIVLFATLRALAGPERGRTAGGVMLALAQVAVVLQAAALGLVLALTLRAEESDPGTARSLLDLSDILVAFSGAAFAITLVAAARVIRRTGDALPARFAEAAIVVAACCLLWTGRLFTDIGALAPDSFLGSELGWLALAAWLLAAGLWLGSGRLTEPDQLVEPESVTVAPPRAPVQPEPKRLPKPEPLPRAPLPEPEPDDESEPAEHAGADEEEPDDAEPDEKEPDSEEPDSDDENQ